MKLPEGSSGTAPTASHPGAQEAELDRVEERLPRGLDDVLVHTDRRPRLLAVGRVDEHPRDRAGSALRVEHAHLVVGEVHALERVHLTDYKVRVLDTQKGTGAATRVLIDSTDGDQTWTTIGVNENIIEASWQALLDSIQFALLRSGA